MSALTGLRAVLAATLVLPAIALAAQPAHADVLEVPSDGFTLDCRGRTLEATSGTFTLASSIGDLTDAAGEPTGAVHYLETTTTGRVTLLDRASGRRYTVGGTDDQGSRLDLTTGPEDTVTGTYRTRWVVRTAGGDVLGELETVVDQATGETTETGSCLAAG